MSAETRLLVETTIRHVKGIVTAVETWLKAPIHR